MIKGKVKSCVCPLHGNQSPGAYQLLTNVVGSRFSGEQENAREDKPENAVFVHGRSVYPEPDPSSWRGTAAAIANRSLLVAQYVESHALPPGRHVKPLRDDLPAEDPDRSKHVGRIKAAARYQVVHPKAEHEQ